MKHNIKLTDRELEIVNEALHVLELIYTEVILIDNYDYDMDEHLDTEPKDYELMDLKNKLNG